jgi:hypothetical protein
MRRSLGAGLAVWVVLSLVLGGALARGGGRAVFAGVSWALAGGLLVAAGWASLALALDLFRGEPVGRGRVAWTFALAAAALLMPVLAAAATALG